MDLVIAESDVILELRVPWRQRRNAERTTPRGDEKLTISSAESSYGPFLSAQR
jgi:hypothetical protein